MAKNQKNTAAVVRELLETPINGLGYDVWDVEYVKEGADWILRITIDSPDGIDIDDCEKVHRFIDPMLDEADPIENAYQLEVSSPGLERDIRTPTHYHACTGEKITLKLFTALDGKKQLTGILTDYDDAQERITLTLDDGSERIIDRSAVSHANLFFDFDNFNFNS